MKLFIVRSFLPLPFSFSFTLNRSTTWNHFIAIHRRLSITFQYIEISMPSCFSCQKRHMAVVFVAALCISYIFVWLFNAKRLSLNCVYDEPFRKNRRLRILIVFFLHFWYVVYQNRMSSL